MIPVVDVAVRSSLVLLAALGVARLLRRQSAARRHLVLASGVAGALTVAPLAWLGPQWTWSLPAAARPPLVQAVLETANGADESALESRAPGPDWLLLVWLGGTAVVSGRLFWRLTRLGALTRLAPRVEGALGASPSRGGPRHRRSPRGRRARRPVRDGDRQLGLAQTDDSALTARARALAATLGLDFERRRTGYGELGASLAHFAEARAA